ncbi:MAG: DUF2062 domain-containing protein [Blastochloris sp.]|nr:DUF2062 domain-containing protein [Blastochloris sp.]
MQLKLFRWLHQRGVSRKRLQGGKLHGWLGDHLFHKDMWRLKREPVARAWLLGSLVSLSPLMGFHLLLACTLALFTRSNIPVAFALQWLTNPLTAPLYYPVAYLLGCRILGYTPESREGWKTIFSHLSKFEFQWIFSDAGELGQMVAALFVGCLALGLALGSAGYLLVHLFWPAAKESEATSDSPS